MKNRLQLRPAAFARCALSLLMLCALLASARADLVLTRAGTEIAGAQVDSWSPEAAPDLFMIRLLESGATDPAVHPVEPSHIARIDFDAGDGIGGRVARMRLANGTVRDRARIISYAGAARTFTVVVPGGGAREEIPAAAIDQIDFMRTELARGTITGPAAAPTPTPQPDSSPAAARTPAPDSNLPDLDYDDDGEFDAPLGIEVMGLGPAMGFDQVAIDDEDFDSDSVSFDDGGGGWVDIPLTGRAIGLLSFLAYLVIASIVGGCYLFWASRLEQVTDFPLWKSMVTAGALSLFPVAVLLLCLRFIPVFGVWAGLAGWYFLSRAIIMGAMEILEEKAGNVLHTYLVIQIGVFLLSLTLL